MLKRNQIEVLPALDKSFARRVSHLADEGTALAKSYADLTARMLIFAERFRILWDEAKKFDKSERGVHRAYLREQIAKAVQSNSAAVWSKWNTIGSNARKLLLYKSALPPQRECLYELARAIDDKKPIEQWIKTGNLSRESTVREVAALCRGKKRKSRPRTYLASVTLSFQTYDEAAEVLKRIVSSDDDFRLRSHQAFEEALKAKLDIAAFEIAKKRFS